MLKILTIGVTLFLIGCGGSSGGTSADSNNPNIIVSEFKNASKINISQETTDNLNIVDGNSVDYFEVNITTVGIYTLYFQSISSGTDTDYAYTLDADIYNSNENFMNKSRIRYALVSDGKESITTEFEVQDPGKYYLKIYRTRVGDIEEKATHYKFSIEPSIANGLIQDADGEFNDVLSQATPLNANQFEVDTNGSVNVTRYNDYSDWYELKDLNTGIYTLYLKTKTGTTGSQGRSLLVKVYDKYGNLYSDLTTNYSIYDMDESNEWVRKTFDVTNADNYFVNIVREYNMASHYALKVLPSINNGYTLDANGEPNDEMALAKSIILMDTNTSVEGSINITDITDSDDWFEFTADITQIVSFKLETLAGTETGSYTLNADFIDSYGNVIKSIPSNPYLLDTANEETTESIELINGNKYYIRINRRHNTPTQYKFTVIK